MAKSFAGTVKQVLGTCLSLGCTVDKQNPKQIIAKLNNGELKVWFDFYLKQYRNSLSLIIQITNDIILLLFILIIK